MENESLKGMFKGGESIPEEAIDEAVDAMNYYKLYLDDLPTDTISKIAKCGYDHFYEGKHETEHWEYSVLKRANVEFMNVANFNVLLPINKEYHKNIIIVRAIIARDKSSIVVLLRDTTFNDSEDEYFGKGQGIIAVCDRFPDEDFYITTLYHECRIFPNLKEQILKDRG